MQWASATVASRLPCAGPVLIAPVSGRSLLRPASGLFKCRPDLIAHPPAGVRQRRLCCCAPCRLGGAQDGRRPMPQSLAPVVGGVPDKAPAELPHGARFESTPYSEAGSYGTHPRVAAGTPHGCLSALCHSGGTPAPYAAGMPGTAYVVPRPTDARPADRGSSVLALEQAVGSVKRSKMRVEDPRQED